MSEKCCCSHKSKHRSENEIKALNNRLKRIEGQVRGVQKMLLNDAYCTDILIQVSAIQSALNSFNKELLEQHLRTCVVEDIKNGDEEVISDLMETIRKLMK